MPESTAEQTAAIQKRGVSVVLSSGAGCGKTSVLTERYLDHLRKGEARVGELVAITFTERAAREMRRRIRAALTVERSRRPAEADLWSEHLRNLETASIQTIHSFCSDILHRYALTAGLDPAFQVLEDVLSVSLRDTVLDESLRTLLVAESSEGDALRSLIEIYGWYVARTGIDNLLSVGDAGAWADWLKRSPVEIAETWREFAQRELQPRLIAHALANDSAIANCLTLLRSTPCSGPKMAANIAAVFDGIERLPTAQDVDANVALIVTAARVQSTEMAKAWADKESYECVKAALDRFRNALSGTFSLPDADNSESSAAIGQQFLRVAAYCRAEYIQRKRQNALVDFDDLIVLTRDLLRQHRSVREELRRRFRVILLDELQDTDPVQMELVDLLCGPGLTAGKLFAVGDAKQSIYRFRGADESLFRSLREQVPEPGRLSLTVNFRSQPAILDFVNTLFAGHMRDYEPLRSHRKQGSAGRCVEFLWSEPAGEVEAGRKLDAAQIAKRIRKMIDDGEPLVVDDNDRPHSVRAGDIVLLFRSMTSVAIYETALREAKLDYYLVGGRAFFAQQEVYDLLNALRAIENPLDSLSLAGALRSPFGGISDESLYWLAKHDDGIWAGLHDPATVATISETDRPHVERAARFFSRWRSVKDRLPIASLINSILDDCGYDAALQFEFLGERKLANLWKLIDLARTFDRTGLFGLADFIQRLSAGVTAQPREEQAATVPEEANVVRLMTIHQAKGLEFPIVFLPDLARKGGNLNTPCAEWDDRLGCVARPPSEDDPPLFSRYAWDVRKKKEQLADWDDDLRTFYVACTRAEDYLVLSGAVDLQKPGANTAMTVLADRFDLGSGTPR